MKAQKKGGSKGKTRGAVKLWEGGGGPGGGGGKKEWLAKERESAEMGAERGCAKKKCVYVVLGERVLLERRGPESS